MSKAFLLFAGLTAFASGQMPLETATKGEDTSAARKARKARARMLTAQREAELRAAKEGNGK